MRSIPYIMNLNDVACVYAVREIPFISGPGNGSNIIRIAEEKIQINSVMDPASHAVPPSSNFINHVLVDSFLMFMANEKILGFAHSEGVAQDLVLQRTDKKGQLLCLTELFNR